jgi:hypothetical protein
MCGWPLVTTDHRAVGQIADALALVLAFADDFQLQDFAGQQNDFQALASSCRLTQFTFCSSAILEIVIVGEQPGVQVAREADEFGVHFLFLGKIAVMDADFDVGVALDAVEHFESAPSARAFDGSAESATCWSSFSTKRGTTMSPSINFASIRSAMRPSMMTLVSSSSRLSGLFCGENRTYGMMSEKSSLLLRMARMMPM